MIIDTEHLDIARRIHEINMAVKADMAQNYPDHPQPDDEGPLVVGVMILVDDCGWTEEYAETLLRMVAKEE